MFSIPGLAQAQDRAGELLEELGAAQSPEAAARAERALDMEWSKSGSAVMDLLLKRGRDALELQQTGPAIQHLTALTDHAPDFAEGWYVLALAYFQAEMLGPSMDALERTLALNPVHFGALRGVAAIHEQIGNEALAYEAYARVLELRPFDEAVTDALERLAGRVQGIEI
ncbi:hypothetical protein KO516_21790 [Citreicella sp. C3M06]|uniref:tetratricopeptide repeat protein n=1 Tax=Roseobacteraceae TaxID=2854170 RepID=UPI001C08D4D4|nr:MULTISPECIES: hypothetical protein [Roseobacteraceae]MBU2963408.1 hypothetical protein [Citreicella sp. C3M06]MDO6585764.1 hypothetical protein [Salipiger sp. 1_MG-2023]